MLRSLLDTCLSDNRQAWDLHSDGSYVQRHPNGAPERSAQAIFLHTSWGLELRDDEKARGRDDAALAETKPV
jgi:hypothetical protein